MITDKSIELIAEQLGMATEQIYEVFVAAQPTIAVIQLSCVFFVIISAIIGYRLADVYEWDCEPQFMGFIFGMCGILLSVIVYDSMRCYFLPEYSAIVKLMELAFGGGI